MNTHTSAMYSARYEDLANSEIFTSLQLHTVEKYFCGNTLGHEQEKITNQQNQDSRNDVFLDDEKHEMWSNETKSRYFFAIKFPT